MRNLLTIDVEEYFQVEGFADVVARDTWDRRESRVAPPTRRILDLLDAARQKATFFVLGWTAERHPALVREIVARGHEVASHGYSHQMADQQGARDFRRDVRKGKKLLEDLIGASVSGYRAPSFSFTDRTPWAHEVLLEEGFVYSSSVFPVRHDRYGVPDAPRHPWEVRDPNAESGAGKTLLELPPLTLRAFGQNLPVAGGGYMRLFPGALMSFAIRRMNAEGFPAMVYLHPWELDPGQPRLPGRRMNRFRHYVGLASMERKLATLMERHAFTSVAQHLGLAPQKPAAAAQTTVSPPLSSVV
ncbi:MAG: DUF3473 domain-containing protein [Planctomycetes bacterium]|nr:DUF3473 domain-containing protein [Planctomycetota bacterium]